jgi:hypothetical protein
MTFNVVGNLTLVLGGYATLVVGADNVAITLGDAIADHTAGTLNAGGEVVLITDQATKTSVCVNQEIAAGNILAGGGNEVCV